MDHDDGGAGGGGDGGGGEVVLLGLLSLATPVAVCRRRTPRGVYQALHASVYGEQKEEEESGNRQWGFGE